MNERIFELKTPYGEVTHIRYLKEPADGNIDVFIGEAGYFDDKQNEFVVVGSQLVIAKIDVIDYVEPEQ